MLLSFRKKQWLSPENSANVAVLWKCGLIAIITPLVCAMFAILTLAKILSSCLFQRRKHESSKNPDRGLALPALYDPAHRIYYSERDTLPRGLRDQISVQMEGQEWSRGLRKGKTLH